MGLLPRQAGKLSIKSIKQHLRIKSVFGTSENTVKTQIWIAITVYVLVAIFKKRLHIEADLYTILRILSLTPFEQTSLIQLLAEGDHTVEGGGMSNHLDLFDNLRDSRGIVHYVDIHGVNTVMFMP